MDEQLNDREIIMLGAAMILSRRGDTSLASRVFASAHSQIDDPVLSHNIANYLLNNTPLEETKDRPDEEGGWWRFYRNDWKVIDVRYRTGTSLSVMSGDTPVNVMRINAENGGFCLWPNSQWIKIKQPD